MTNAWHVRQRGVAGTAGTAGTCARNRSLRNVLRALWGGVVAAAVGVQVSLPTTARADQTVIIDGRGFGHGAGMAQDGAYWLGRSGRSAGQILQTFYPGTTLGNRGGQIRVPLASAGAVTLGFPDGGTVGGIRVPVGSSATIRSQAGSLRVSVGSAGSAGDDAIKDLSISADAGTEADGPSVKSGAPAPVTPVAAALSGGFTLAAVSVGPSVAVVSLTRVFRGFIRAQTDVTTTVPPASTVPLVSVVPVLVTSTTTAAGAVSVGEVPVAASSLPASSSSSPIDLPITAPTVAVTPAVTASSTVPGSLGGANPAAPVAANTNTNTNTNTVTPENPLSQGAEDLLSERPGSNSPLSAAGGATMTASSTGGLINVGGRRFRGAIELQSRGGGVRVVNVVDVEQYLRGMGEILSRDWPAATLQTQAIAARTYALRMMGSRGEVCPTQACQVYLGAQVEYAQMDAAVRATSGKVVLYKGALANTFYSASGGGTIASPEEAFGGNAEVPYLKAGVYPTGDLKPWTVSLSLGEIARRVGYRGSPNGVAITRLGPSGRATEVTITGSAGPLRIPGVRFDAALGLRSTYFRFRGTDRGMEALAVGGSIGAGSVALNGVAKVEAPALFDGPPSGFPTGDTAAGGLGSQTASSLDAAVRETFAPESDSDRGAATGSSNASGQSSVSSSVTVSSTQPAARLERRPPTQIIVDGDDPDTRSIWVLGAAAGALLLLGVGRRTLRSRKLRGRGR